jgi:hypothetical protein
LLYAKLAKDPPARCHVVQSFHKCHQICVICQYIVVLTPLGLHIQTCRFLLSNKEPGVGSQAYIPTCLPVALDEDGGSLLLCFMLCTRKVEDLCNLDLRYNIDAIAMITYFVLCCYLLIQGMAQIHRSSVFR